MENNSSSPVDESTTPQVYEPPKATFVPIDLEIRRETCGKRTEHQCHNFNQD